LRLNLKGAVNLRRGTFSFSDCQFSFNRAGGEGGGVLILLLPLLGKTLLSLVHILPVPHLPIIQLYFLEFNLEVFFNLGPNLSSKGAISLACNAARNINITHSAFYGNLAGGDGGAIHRRNEDYFVYIENNLFSGNVALDDGGAINNDRVNQQTRIYLNTFEKNQASDQGGALRSNGGFFSSRQKNSTA